MMKSDVKRPLYGVVSCKIEKHQHANLVDGYDSRHNKSLRLYLS